MVYICLTVRVGVSKGIEEGKKREMRDAFIFRSVVGLLLGA